MKIVKYQAAWKIRSNEGIIRVALENRDRPKNIPISNSAEFVAILSILQGDGTAYLNRNGWIGTIEDQELI